MSSIEIHRECSLTKVYRLTPSVESNPRNVERTFDRLLERRVPTMDEGGEGRRRRGELTPEQEAERFSTGGVGFEESLRSVLAGGLEPEDTIAEEVTETERRMTPQERQELLEREQERMRDPEYRRSLIPPPAFMQRALRQQENC
jgi:hypothetical protein